MSHLVSRKIAGAKRAPASGPAVKAIVAKAAHIVAPSKPWRQRTTTGDHVGAAPPAVPTALPDHHRCFALSEVGSGTPDEPFRLPLRTTLNASGCNYCPTATCHCALFSRLFDESVDELNAKQGLRRVTEVAGKRELCAKSILPPFVERLSAVLRLTPQDTFYDLGSGNGSVVFQVAFTVGCPVVGVEISRENAQLSSALWDVLRPKLERAAGRAMPPVSIVCGDLRDVIADPAFGSSPNTAIWSSNLLLPREITHFMSERFRQLSRGVRIVVFDDLYPHGRSVARVRDPESFRLFSMTDYIWTSGTVEWTFQEGKFYANEKLL